ncbi:MAG: ABC transporter permease [Micrococcales bacterium]|nr:ABC transporter permease [Micrococcales bacterium]
MTAVTDVPVSHQDPAQIADTTRRRPRPSGWGLALATVLVIELVIFSTTNRNFFGGGFGMLSQIDLFIPTALVAIGLAMVVLTGDIDLSVGATASLSSVVVGRVILSSGNVLLAIVVAVAVGALIGLINGVLVAYLRLDSLLVTLAMQFAVSSFAQAFAGTNPPQGFPVGFQAIGRGSMANIPSALLLFLVVGLIVMFVVGKTRFGRRTVLIGYNMSASRYSGLPVRRTRLGLFVACAAIASIGGVLLSAYYNAGRPQAGMSVLMPALTCVVLGGVDVFGGKGRIGDVIIAALLLGFLTQGLLNSGVSSLAATMVTGLLLVVALIVKTISEKKSIGWLAGRLGQRFTQVGKRR